MSLHLSYWFVIQFQHASLHLGSYFSRNRPQLSESLCVWIPWIFLVFFLVFFCARASEFFFPNRNAAFSRPQMVFLCFCLFYLRPTVITNVNHAVFVYPVTTAWCSCRFHVYHTTDILSHLVPTWSTQVLVSTVLYPREVLSWFTTLRSNRTIPVPARIPFLVKIGR